MKSLKITFFSLFFALLQLNVFAQNSFETSIDQNALRMMNNPSSGWLNKGSDIVGWGYAMSYNRLFAGVGEGINRANIAVYRDYGKKGFGLNLSAIATNMYYRTDIKLPLMIQIRNLKMGIAPGFVLDGFNSNKFYYGENSDEILYDPLLRNNLNAYSLTLDVGFSVQFKKLRFTVSGEDIFPAKLGDETAVADPTILEFATIIPVSNWKTQFALSVSNELNAPDGDNWLWSISAESNIISNNLGLKAGINNREISLGIIFDISNTFGLGNVPETKADISVHHPINEMSGIGNTINFCIFGNSSKVLPLPDLTIECIKNDKVYLLDDTIHVKLRIKNIGNKNSSESQLQIAFLDDTLTTIVGGVNDNDYYEYSHILEVDRAGKYPVFAQINMNEREQNPDNNKCQQNLNISPEPEVDILTESSVMSLKSISYIYQDEGVVPSVFFDKNSDKINGRFNGMLLLIAERMLLNPDIHLSLQGFITHDENSNDMSYNRVLNVKNKLIEQASQIDNTKDIANRINVLSKNGQNEYASSRKTTNQRVLSERRFVDFNAFLPENIANHYSIKFENTQVDFEKMDRIVQILDNNPELVYIIEGKYIVKIDEYESFDKANEIRSRIIEHYGKGYEEKFFPAIAKLNDSLEIESNYLSGFLSASGLLYKPRIFHASSNFEPGDNMACDMTLKASGLPVKKWSVDLIENNTKQFTIQSGDNTVPSEIVWDFKDKDGNMIAVDKTYQLRFDLKDIAEQTDTAYAENSVETNIENSENRTERLLLVQFQFNQPAAKSRYLDDRLAIIAEKMIRTISEYNTTNIVFEGHSDDIGSLRRNTELSQERADAVRNRMMLTMATLLDTDMDGLQKWLMDHNTTIESKGFAYTKPYTVISWQGNNPIEKLIGNNKLPEGRTINRCVIMSIESEK